MYPALKGFMRKWDFNSILRIITMNIPPPFS